MDSTLSSSKFSITSIDIILLIYFSYLMVSLLQSGSSSSWRRQTIAKCNLLCATKIGYAVFNSCWDPSTPQISLANARFSIQQAYKSVGECGMTVSLQISSKLLTRKKSTNRNCRSCQIFSSPTITFLMSRNIQTASSYIPMTIYTKHKLAEYLTLTKLHMSVVWVLARLCSSSQRAQLQLPSVVLMMPMVQVILWRSYWLDVCYRMDQQICRDWGRLPALYRLQAYSILRFYSWQDLRIRVILWIYNLTVFMNYNNILFPRFTPSVCIFCANYAHPLLKLQVHIILLLISVMNSKHTRKLENNCRKKMILGDRNVPQPNPYKLVWVINMEGSTFIPVNNLSQFQGDPQVKNIMMQKAFPQINKSVGKIWINQIFPTVHTLIKILLLLLCISMTIILVFSQFHSTTNYIILIVYLYCVLICSIVIILYTFRKEYKTEDYDENIIKEIKEILYEYNHLYLKPKGYTAKCDEWGIWISVGEVNMKQVMSRSISNDSM